MEKDINSLVATNSSFSEFNQCFTTSGSGNLSSGTTTTSNMYYYPGWSSWGWYSVAPSKTEKAYAVIRALIKAKLVKITTLNRFFELMDEVVKVL